jgi:hypothetical protein
VLQEVPSSASEDRRLVVQPTPHSCLAWHCAPGTTRARLSFPSRTISLAHAPLGRNGLRPVTHTPTPAMMCDCVRRSAASRAAVTLPPTRCARRPRRSSHAVTRRLR